MSAMRSLVITAVVCFVFAAFVPPSDAIDCYVEDLNHKVHDCAYCGFSNVTYNNQHSDVSYLCLYSAQLSTAGFNCTAVNQCQKSTLGGSQTPVQASLYMCDKDLCNEHCDATRAGIGFIAIISTFMISFLRN